MPKIVDKEQMRHNILNAALKAFGTYGFHNTSMAKIAQECQLSKGTLYLYFPSKEALSLQLMHRFIAEIKATWMPEAPATSPETLLQQIRNAAILNEEQVTFITVFFEAFGPSFSSESFKQELAALFEDFAHYYHTSLQHMQQQGAIAPHVNTPHLARVLVSAFDGIMFHRGLFIPSAQEHEGMVDALIDLLQRGLMSCQSKES